MWRALLPLAVSGAINWAKFDTLNAYPMADQVHSRSSVFRQEALDANGGDLFGVDLVPSTLLAYLRPDGIRFTNQYPFVDAPQDVPSVVGGAFFDTLNRTPSIVPFMPLLVGVAGWGAVMAIRARRRTPLAWVRLPLFGAAVVPCCRGRDRRHHARASPWSSFPCSASVLQSAWWTSPAVWDADRRPSVASCSAHWPRWPCSGYWPASVYALTTRATSGSGHNLADHVSRQAWFVDHFGDGLDQVVTSEALPREASAGEIRILGDCVAMFYSTGEHGHTTRPWLQVSARPLAFSLTRQDTGPRSADPTVPVAEFDGLHGIRLSLERTGDDFRFVLSGGGADEAGDAFDLGVGESVDVLIDPDPPYTYAVVVDGEPTLEVPKEDQDELYQSQPNVLDPQLPTEIQTQGLGVTITDKPVGRDALCERLLADAQDRGDP